MQISGTRAARARYFTEPAFLSLFFGTVNNIYGAEYFRIQEREFLDSRLSSAKPGASKSC
jgi:hypothetical protein